MSMDIAASLVKPLFCEPCCHSHPGSYAHLLVGIGLSSCSQRGLHFEAGQSALADACSPLVAISTITAAGTIIAHIALADPLCCHRSSMARALLARAGGKWMEGQRTICWHSCTAALITITISIAASRLEVMQSISTLRKACRWCQLAYACHELDGIFVCSTGAELELKQSAP